MKNSEASNPMNHTVSCLNIRVLVYLTKGYKWALFLNMMLVMLLIVSCIDPKSVVKKEVRNLEENEGNLI